MSDDINFCVSSLKRERNSNQNSVMDQCSYSSVERRKHRKVLVERKRRERIDRCFERLKNILQADPGSLVNAENSGLGSCDGKLEKADILERTVSYLHRLHQQRTAETALGFNACLREVERFLKMDSSNSHTTAAAFPTQQLIGQLRQRAEQLLMIPHPTQQLQPQQQLCLRQSSFVTSGCHGNRQQRRSSCGRRQPLQTIDNRWRESSSLGRDFYCEFKGRSSTIHIPSSGYGLSGSGQSSSTAAQFLSSSIKHPVEKGNYSLSQVDFDDASHVTDEREEIIRQRPRTRSNFSVRTGLRLTSSNSIRQETNVREESDSKTGEAEQNFRLGSTKRKQEFDNLETKMSKKPMNLSVIDERMLKLHPTSEPVGSASPECLSAIWRPWRFSVHNNNNSNSDFNNSNNNNNKSET